jgi:hypothetical protein
MRRQRRGFKRRRRGEEDAEKKKKEEEAEAQRAAEAVAAETAAAEKSSEEAAVAEGEKMNEDNTNAYINDINNGGNEEMEEEAMEPPVFNLGDEDSEAHSPPKKRKKKDKKEKSKKRESSIPPSLRTGRDSKEGQEERKKKEDEVKARAEKASAAARQKAKEEEAKEKERLSYIHRNSRVVVECSVVCSQEDEQQRYNELPGAVRALLKNMQKVDDKVCLDPVEDGEAKRIWNLSEIPYDHTELGSWVVQSGGVQAFAMKKPRKWGKKNEVEGDDEAMVMPEVYFTISFSCDKDPQKVLDRIAGEWGKLGGKKLYIKEVASFATQTVVNIFHLRNDNTLETIMAEFRSILQEAKAIAETEDPENAGHYSWMGVPDLGLRKLMPKITGQDTSLFQGWSGRQHEMRKTLTIEADEKHVEMLQYWVETAKNRKLFELKWGNKVRVATVLDNKTKRKGHHRTHTKVDMAAMASYSRKHINYHSSTRMDGIRGIFHLDKEVPFYSVTDPTKLMGKITLRRVLYKYIKMSDDHGLFEEVHQAEPMGAVDVSIPNCEEAERMMLMLHKNSAAYLWNYLQTETKLGVKLITDLIRASMDPILVNGMSSCKWEREHWILTTPEDAENEKLKAMEDAAWYNDEFGNHMVDVSRKEKVEYASKEAMAELHCDHSYKSIHQKKGNYVGSPGEESFQLGSKGKPVYVDGEAVGDEEGYGNLTPAELIAMLKKHNISPKGAVGSPPSKEGSGSGRSVEGGESTDSSAASSSGSSVSDESSNVMSVTKDATSSPSDGDGTAGRKPDHGE